MRADVYRTAVESELQRSHGSSLNLDTLVLPPTNRPGAVSAWCKRRRINPPNKRNVAYRVVEKSHWGSIVEPIRVEEVDKLDRSVRALLGLEGPSSDSG